MLAVLARSGCTCLTFLYWGDPMLTRFYVLARSQNVRVSHFHRFVDLRLTEVHLLARSQDVRSWHFRCFVDLTHWVSSVGTFTVRTCLIFYLLGWLRSEWVSCIGTFAASTCLTIFPALILTEFHLLACSASMCLKPSLLSILTGFHVFAYSQAVRAWHFPYSVDLKRLASFMCLLVHRLYVDVISLLVWCHADRFFWFLIVRRRYVHDIFISRLISSRPNFTCLRVCRTYVLHNFLTCSSWHSFTFWRVQVVCAWNFP